MKSGTPGYVAPEILRSEGYNSKCDIFSLGSLMFNLLTGLYLFSGEDQKEILLKNKACDTSKIGVVLTEISHEGVLLLNKLLIISPNNRPTAEQALACNWFQQDRQVIDQFIEMNMQIVRNTFNTEGYNRCSLGSKPQTGKNNNQGGLQNFTAIGG